MASRQVEQQLILISAGTGARRLAMAELADRLAADVDWRSLAATLHSRRLLPTLGPRIVDLANGRADPAFSAEVDRSIAAGRRHGAFLQLVAVRAIAMLAEAGIRSSPLKGPLLGEVLYGDPGRRPSGDVDLLVPADQLHMAVDVIRGLGYGAPNDYVDDRSGLPLLHLMLVHERQQLPPIELHWRVHWYEERFARERLLPPPDHALGDWRPEPADELVALLLFYARDGFVDLRLASDLGAWWDAHGAAVPHDAIADLVFAYPQLARVVVVAATVAEKMVGLPARQIIRDAPTLRVRERMAARLANPHPRSSSAQLYADIGLIDGLLMPRGDFNAFVRRQVLPPPQVLDQHARHASRRRARSPLARGLGVLGRYGLTMARLARAPETLV
ncbi:MAG TPA: nucleotidyltransferase family protein [Solirubrobacteraceae bacterium]|jgi:hypothetical protein|nr:nucleotidyltransferase family protein [Solirubrobacteraceae bacterium]